MEKGLRAEATASRVRRLLSIVSSDLIASHTNLSELSSTSDLFEMAGRSDGFGCSSLVALELMSSSFVMWLETSGLSARADEHFPLVQKHLDLALTSEPCAEMHGACSFT